LEFTATPKFLAIEIELPAFAQKTLGENLHGACITVEERPFQGRVGRYLCPQALATVVAFGRGLDETIHRG
jgi:hypothetical protein